MTRFQIFTFAFLGKIAATLFILLCTALGFGPDSWIAFLLGPNVVPFIARILFLAAAGFVLGFVSGATYTLFKKIRSKLFG